MKAKKYIIIIGVFLLQEQYLRAQADSLELSGDVTGSQFAEACYGIRSTARIKGGIGTLVEYKAGVIILLEDGFSVEAQSDFDATIGACSNPVSNRASGNQVAIDKAESSPVSLTANRLKIYPNPFPQQTIVEFYIEKQTAVTINLMDLSGKMVKVVFKSTLQSPGKYQVRLDGAELSSGTYILHLQTPYYQESKKVVIAK